jgi:TrmH family RNA methyltransferase
MANIHELTTDLITSFTNPTVKRARRLADRRHRRREGAFLVEGLQPVWRAVTAGWPIETLVVAPDLLVNPAGRDLVATQERAGTPVARVSREVFLRISDRDGPAGLAGIVRGTVGGLPDLPPAGGSVLVALHRVGNPGNLGTIVRTADAAGAGAVILIGDTADPLAPASVKASMGSVFAVPVVQTPDFGHFFGWAREQHRPVCAATGVAREQHWDIRYPGSTVLLFGSEGDGLPPEVIAACDRSVRIPMAGTADSLNLATAVAILLYEVARDRRPDRLR